MAILPARLCLKALLRNFKGLLGRRFLALFQKSRSCGISSGSQSEVFAIPLAILPKSISLRLMAFSVLVRTWGS